MKNEDFEIEKLKNCERKAFDKLFRKYAGIVKAIAYRYVKDWEKADDIVQETFIIIYKKIEQYEGRGSFEGWLKRIAVNTALKHIKEEQKNRKEDVENYQLTEEKEEEVNEEDMKSLIESVDFSKDEILEVVMNLPKGFRTVFCLYVLDNFRHKEIAEQLGISESTSKTQLLRARKLLQKRLFILAKEKHKVKKVNFLKQVIGKRNG